MGNATIANLPEKLQRQVREKWAAEDAARAAPIAPVSPPKYGNIRTPYKSTQGFERVYDSKAEAHYAMTLDQGIALGLVSWWIPQPAFPLPGKKTYRGDFLVRWSDRIAVVDVKGMDTPMSKLKRDQVKALYGIDVEIISK